MIGPLRTGSWFKFSIEDKLDVLIRSYVKKLRQVNESDMIHNIKHFIKYGDASLLLREAHSTSPTNSIILKTQLKIHHLKAPQKIPTFK